ncbi:MAG TPA: polysaccharide biosynthesis/export family protein [Vicinamibacterales bacterium]|nr:polysaccharide biosynthesis/export family protein [Vicinamibacterales bacterium]
MITIALLLTLLQLPQNAQSPPPAASKSAADDYIIGPQDVLNVTVFGEADASRMGVTVDNDGTIDCPYIGRVQAGGQSARALEKEIRVRLAKGFLVNPSVSVEVVKYRSKSVIVQGQVRTPGEFILQGNVSIMSVLAQAGSLTADAGSYVLISRRGANGKPEEIKVSRRALESGQAQNVQLKDGDTILVPKAETFFILGVVRSPGQYTYEDGLTVERALSLAGGATDRAATNRITIERRVGSALEKIKAKLTDLIQPNDTVKVPTRIF